jgi:ribonuclease HI
MSEIVIYTDGAMKGNQKKHLSAGRKGGVGVFFGDNDNRNISLSIVENKCEVKSNEIYCDKISNQVCELLAVIFAIEKVINENKQIVIYTDSMYVINSITKWAKKWEKNDWKKSDNNVILNKELIQKLYNLSNKYKVKYNHIRSHISNIKESDPNYNHYYGNKMADLLAVNGTLSN